MVVGAILLAVAFFADDDGGGRVTAGSTTAVRFSTTPGRADVEVGTTAPVTDDEGLGEGFAPERRGRRALRGFGEVTATITSGSGETCEVCLLAAGTEAQRERGLMEVTDEALGGYDGMVFLYPEPIKGAFWMRNTPQPLSIAYFGPDGRLVSTANMSPCEDKADCRSYPAAAAFSFALEVPQGRLDDVKVEGAASIVVRFEACPLREQD